MIVPRSPLTPMFAAPSWHSPFQEASQYVSANVAGSDSSFGVHVKVHPPLVSEEHDDIFTVTSSKGLNVVLR